MNQRVNAKFILENSERKQKSCWSNPEEKNKWKGNKYKGIIVEW